MLEGEHRRGYKYRHLFRVGSRFECRPYSHLGLAETHIAADEAVHGFNALHVGLHFLRGFHLVGGVFIKETGFKFVLHERVVTESESLFVLAFGVEFY